MLTHDTLVEGERPPLVQIQLPGSFSGGGGAWVGVGASRANTTSIIQTVRRLFTDYSRLKVIHPPSAL